MRTGNASGLQILFLSFAIMLLAVPLSSFISSRIGSTDAEAAFIGRGIPFVLGALALMAFPPLRKRTFAYLSHAIPEQRRAEVVIVGSAKVILAFAFIGAWALWYWVTEGSPSLAHHAQSAPLLTMKADAFTAPVMLTTILLGALFAPFIEEILYRGLLHDAWAPRFGHFAATVFTSALFAWYHVYPFAAFASAIVFTCLVRRTGSLWSSIAVHSFFNLMLWYPLIGRFLIPDPSNPLGDLSTWSFHLACLLIAAVALPAYILLAAFRPYEPPVELS